ncbi:MAG: 1-acyl-sn-glycerol-3-phosphate acyltransferase [Proteobacteria bacterium]|nr:1-acyl-sn-glycerol-3-phosphate acyltransferase [Pseudomonadota bacterium]
MQREVGRWIAPLWVPLSHLVLRFGFGYRIENLAAARARYRELRRQHPGPVLVCANHLTLVDSFLVAWALRSVWHYTLHWDGLPWNVPERTNFAAGPLSKCLAYLAKCIPITRGGDRREVASVLERVTRLTQEGEVALVFPEGGRSRSGHVETNRAAYGVGRIVNAIPGCQVICVYLRGRRQSGFGDFPVRGERFDVELSCIEPRSSKRGLRRSRDLVQQIVDELARLEKGVLDGRQ